MLLRAPSIYTTYYTALGGSKWKDISISSIAVFKTQYISNKKNNPKNLKR